MAESLTKINNLLEIKPAVIQPIHKDAPDFILSYQKGNLPGSVYLFGLS
jgi:hypothetical protein